LLLLYPERAKPIVMFRHRTMQPARERARQYGARGTMYPWESDPETGVDHTPYFAYGVWREIHVNADIAIAQWQYYLATGDRAWLREYGWPVIRELAEVWVSRVELNAAEHRYEIHHVTSPDEAHGDDPNELMMVRLAVHAAELGDVNAAGVWIARNLVGFLEPPFDVRCETAANNAGYCLSTSAGCVQSFVYGLSGLRIDDKGLSEAYPPVLPDGWRSVTLKNIAFRGQRYDVVVSRDAGGKVRLKIGRASCRERG